MSQVISRRGRTLALATAPMSSTRPRAPSPIINAIDAIIDGKSDSVPDASAARALSTAVSQRAEITSTHASTAWRATFSSSDSGPAASSVENRRCFRQPSQRPDQVGRPHDRPEMPIAVAGFAYHAEELLRIVAAAH